MCAHYIVDDFKWCLVFTLMWKSHARDTITVCLVYYYFNFRYNLLLLCKHECSSSPIRRWWPVTCLLIVIQLLFLWITNDHDFFPLNGRPHMLPLITPYYTINHVQRVTTNLFDIIAQLPCPPLRVKKERWVRRQVRRIAREKSRAGVGE